MTHTDQVWHSHKAYHADPCSPRRSLYAVLALRLQCPVDGIVRSLADARSRSVSVQARGVGLVTSFSVVAVHKADALLQTLYFHSAPVC